MKCVIRCSSGGGEGWGNLFRILVLRENLIRNFKSKVYLVINGNAQVKKYLKSKKIQFISIKKNNQKIEKKKIKNIGLVDLAIIEMLNPTINIQKTYVKISKKLVILDDILKNNYISDVLISGQNTKIKPKRLLKTKFFSGYKYFPFNKNFENFINKKKTIEQNIKKISICLGGSLYKNYLLKIAEQLKSFKDVNFIIGAELTTSFKLKLLKINKNFKIIHLPKNIPYLLFSSDLVITGGGYTKIETACVGTPLIGIAVHNHQIPLLKEFDKKFNIDFLKLSEINILKKTIKNLTLKKRIFQNNKFKRYFKINGVNRIISKII